MTEGVIEDGCDNREDSRPRFGELRVVRFDRRLLAYVRRGPLHAALAIALVLLVVLTAYVGTIQGSAEYQLRMGLHEIEQSFTADSTRHLETALAHLQRSLEYRPASSTAHFLIARTQRRLAGRHRATHSSIAQRPALRGELLRLWPWSAAHPAPDSRPAGVVRDVRGWRRACRPESKGLPSATRDG